MATNWTNTVNRINKERFTIPAGWNTRDEVAESLECDPSKVSDILKPGIQSGDIERQDFPLWDEKRRMTVRVVCYREKPADAVTAVVVTDSPKRERILIAIRKYPNLSDSLISRKLNKCTSAEVAEVRRGM